MVVSRVILFDNNFVVCLVVTICGDISQWWVCKEKRWKCSSTKV